MQHPVVFSIAEANRRVPWLEAVTRDIVSLAADLEDRRERLSELERLHDESSGDSPHADEVLEMQEAVKHDRMQFETYEHELQQAGVELVDRQTGTVQIRSQLDERPIWLNWQPGELEFTFWRAEDDDPMIRRTLLESVGRAVGGVDEFSGDRPA